MGLAASVFVLLAIAGPASAKRPSPRSSTAEDVAFAFYKLSGTAPDFQRWVDKTPVPKEITVAAQPRYRKALLRRLQALYKDYDSEKLLIVEAHATLVVRSAPVVKGSFFTAEEWFTPGFDLDLGAESKAPYFPYSVADQWVTVVAKDIEKHLTLDMSQQDVDKLKPAFGFIGAMRERPVTLTFTLKPLSADATTPLRLNGVYQWLVMAEVLTVALWNKEGELVWQTHKENYVPESQKQIEDLFRE